jgi:hypothetical protein
VATILNVVKYARGYDRYKFILQTHLIIIIKMCYEYVLKVIFFAGPSVRDWMCVLAL